MHGFPIIVNKNGPNRLSHAVRSMVDGLAFLKLPLQMGMVNYSALARYLQPSIERQLNAKINTEAITMALHRHVRPGAEKLPAEVFKVIAACRVQLAQDVSILHFPFNRKNQEDLAKAKANIEFEGGKAYLIERSDEMTLITQSRFYHDVLANVRAQPMETRERLSMVTISYGIAGVRTPGVINYFSAIIGQAGVNVWGVMMSYSKISFVIDEAESQIAYDHFMRAIQAAREFA